MYTTSIVRPYKPYIILALMPMYSTSMKEVPTYQIRKIELGIRRTNIDFG
jgi:hypothetical protein